MNTVSLHKRNSQNGLVYFWCLLYAHHVKNDNQENDFKPDMKYLTESYQRLKRKAPSKKDHVCDSAPNKNLCLPKSYSKFELPLPDRVNTVEIGIDIIDVLRINDKVSFQNFICHTNF